MESQGRSGLVVEHTSAQPAGCLLHRTSQTRGRKPYISRVVFSDTSSLPHNLPEIQHLASCPRCRLSSSPHYLRKTLHVTENRARDVEFSPRPRDPLPYPSPYPYPFTACTAPADCHAVHPPAGD